MAGADDVPMTDVTDSSAIASHGYNIETRKMRVKFKGDGTMPGGTYELDDVPPERYAAFTGAKSMGTFYGKKIAPLHQARKVK